MDPLAERPLRRSTAHPVDIAGDVVVVDLGAMRAYQLNVSAAAVWHRCDGTHTRAEIVAAVSAQFTMKAAVIDGDVRSTIAHLEQIGLVETADNPRVSCDDAPVIERRASGVASFGVDPSPCQRAVDEMGWTHRVALAVAGFHVGVRTMDPEVADLVASSFAALVVEDDDAPANFSVLVDRPGGRPRGGPSRHGVFDGHRWCGAPSGDDGVIDVLARRLGALHPLASNAVRIDAPIVRAAHGVIVLAGYGASAQFSALRKLGGQIEPGPVVVEPSPDGWVATARPMGFERSSGGSEAGAAPLAFEPSSDGRDAGARTDRTERTSGGWIAAAGQFGSEPLLAVVVAGDEAGVVEPALGMQLVVPFVRAAPADDRAALVDAAARLVGAVGVHRCRRHDLPSTIGARLRGPRS